MDQELKDCGIVTDITIVLGVSKQEMSFSAFRDFYINDPRIKCFSEWIQ